MDYVLNVIIGLFGGLLGGMGMGGGTILIPLLSIFCGVSQHSVQACNLISFIPMAIMALIIHIKNKLVIFNDIIIIIVSGIVTCVLGSYIAKNIGGEVLKRLFGGFLIIMSIWQLIKEVYLNNKCR